jgi:hypothetical protein
MPGHRLRPARRSNRLRASLPRRHKPKDALEDRRGVVEQSSAGMTARELEKAVHVPNLKPLLSRLASQAQVQRAEIGGSLVYLVVESARGQQQSQGCPLLFRGRGLW